MIRIFYHRSAAFVGAKAFRPTVSCFSTQTAQQKRALSSTLNRHSFCALTTARASASGGTRPSAVRGTSHTATRCLPTIHRCHLSLLPRALLSDPYPFSPALKHYHAQIRRLRQLTLERFISHYPRRKFRANRLPNYNIFRWGCTPPIYTFGPYDSIWECLDFTIEHTKHFYIDETLISSFPMFRIAKIQTRLTYIMASTIVEGANAHYNAHHTKQCSKGALI